MKFDILKHFKKKEELTEGPFRDPYATSGKKPPAPQKGAKLRKEDIHELDYSSVEAQKEVAATSFSALSGFGAQAEKEDEDYQFSAKSVTLNLPHATSIAKKYLITHALLPNNIEPIKAMKRDAGGYYFEFKDRGVIHSVTLDEKGEVIEWEKRER
ncbi:MAG: hypothetical protein ABH829_03590 [archaeon]